MMIKIDQDRKTKIKLSVLNCKCLGYSNLLHHFKVNYRNHDHLKVSKKISDQKKGQMTFDNSFWPLQCACAKLATGLMRHGESCELLRFLQILVLSYPSAYPSPTPSSWNVSHLLYLRNLHHSHSPFTCFPKSISCRNLADPAPCSYHSHTIAWLLSVFPSGMQAPQRQAQQ